MRIAQISTGDPVCCARTESVQQAALLMRQCHVGDVVVVDSREGLDIPIGIVTDRDIVVSVVALGLDPASLQVGDVMSEDLLVAALEDDVVDTIEHMRVRGLRRVPVTDRRGHLVGIVSADDVFAFLAEEITDLSRIGAYQQAHERHARQ